MAAKEVVVKKYVVRLSLEERAQLNDLIHKGKRSAQLLAKAHILLKSDVSEAGEGWSDSRIAEELDTSLANILRTRRQLVEEGFEAVLRSLAENTTRTPPGRVFLTAPRKPSGLCACSRRKSLSSTSLTAPATTPSGGP